MKKISVFILILIFIVSALMLGMGCKKVTVETTAAAETTAAETTAAAAETTAAETKPEEIITLNFWHHEAPAHRVAAIQQAIDLFEKEFPNIKVKQDVVMWGDAWTKTLAAVDAGDGPDFQFSIPDLTQSIYRVDALLPVTDLVKELDQKYNLTDNVAATFAYKDEYWSVPAWTMMFLLTYRPSLLEKYMGTKEPPKDWVEYLEYAKKCTDPKNDIYGIGLGGAINLMTSEQVYTFMTNTGAKFFDEKGNVTFNSPETKKAFQMYKDLFQYTVPGAEAWNWGEIELNMEAGKIAMSPYFPSLQRRYALEVNTDDYAGVAHPYPADGQPGTIQYPNGIDIYKWTAEKPGHLEAVYEFIRFLYRPEINIFLTAVAEPGGFYPVSETAMNSPEFWNDPIIKRYEQVNRAAVEQLSIATLYGFEYGRWVNLGLGDISGANILAEAANKMLTGGESIDDALAWGQKEMEKYSEPVGQ